MKGTKLFWIGAVTVMFAVKMDGQNIENSVTDIDGNRYDVVAIGNQQWMKENLRTSSYSDGAPIFRADKSTEWSLLTSGAYCWYNNDSAAYNIPYGKLYNWYAVQNGNLCPTGWHVPSDFEWADLAEFLGGNKVAGGKLKENSGSYWKQPNKDASNESGYTALPGGYRNGSGIFYYLGYFDYWWSSTERSPGSSWYWYVYFDTGYLYRDKDYMTMGHAVRCIKD
jgi:uncharacterized protein (TIGR02145 family)